MAGTSINPILQSFVEAAKKIAFRYTKLGAPGYAYCIEPIELATLVKEIERLKDTAGAIVEIGVARGMTTRFLAEHMISSGCSDQVLYAIDTFSSFTEADLDHEVTTRGKSREQLKGFDYNDYATWSRNFAQYPFIKPVQADCAKFDYRNISPIKLVFLDVDLYLPTKTALPKLYDVLTDDGVILVDDVREGGAWDGAFQAYMEFCKERGRAPQVIGNRCGVIRKTGGQ